MLFQPRQPASLSVQASCRTDGMQTGSLRRLLWHSSSPDLNPLDCHIWDIMLEKYHKLQLKHKTTDELKVALQTILGRDATRIREQGGSDLHQVPDYLHGCGCQWWSLQAPAVTLSVCKSAS